MLNVLTASLSNKNFLQFDTTLSNAEKLPSEDKSYDAIVSFNTRKVAFSEI